MSDDMLNVFHAGMVMAVSMCMSMSFMNMAVSMMLLMVFMRMIVATCIITMLVMMRVEMFLIAMFMMVLMSMLVFFMNMTVCMCVHWNIYTFFFFPINSHYHMCSHNTAFCNCCPLDVYLWNPQII